MITTIIRLATIDPTITATGAAESEPEGLPPEPGGPGSVDPIEPDGAVACTEILDPKELVVSSSGFAPDVFVEFGLPPEPVVVVVAVPELEVDDLSLEEVRVLPLCEGRVGHIGGMVNGSMVVVVVVVGGDLNREVGCWR